MKLKYVLASVLMAVSGIAAAADKEIEDLLAAMRTAYSSSKTAKLTTKTTMSVEGKDLESTFEITFKGPDKVYMYTDSMFGVDGKIKLVCDGKNIVVTTPEDKDEQPFTIELLSSAFPINLESMCFWDYKRQLNTGEDGNMRKSEFKLMKEQDWNEKKWTVLEETATEQEVFVKYWIDPKSHFIWRTEVFALATKDKVMTCEVKKLDTGITVEDSLFDGTFSFR